MEPGEDEEVGDLAGSGPEQDLAQQIDAGVGTEGGEGFPEAREEPPEAVHCVRLAALLMKVNLALFLRPYLTTMERYA